MKDIFVYGAGGMGREIYELVEYINSKENRWNLKGFIDDGEMDVTPEGHRVFGGIDYLRSIDHPVDVVMGIADTKIKKKLVEKLYEAENISFPTIIHPFSNVSGKCRMGKGCIVTYSCTVATNAELEEFVFMNIGAKVGHDTVIGKYSTLMPAVNISGCCISGEGVLFGTNSSVIPGKTIGDYSVIGAGTTIFRNVPERVTVLGNPGKIFKF